MRTERLTIRLNSALRARVKKRATSLGVAESDLVRQALEAQMEGDDAPSAFDLFERAGLIGQGTRGPRDLSTNKKHMDGFGKRRR